MSDSTEGKYFPGTPKFGLRVRHRSPRMNTKIDDAIRVRVTVMVNVSN